jgi:hypothetical protein
MHRKQLVEGPAVVGVKGHLQGAVLAQPDLHARVRLQVGGEGGPSGDRGQPGSGQG